jgi:E3 ubiquitin-protein ligase TRIP12
VNAPLALLTRIHLLCPSAPLENESLGRVVVSRIGEAVSSIGRFAPDFGTIQAHPYLFPLSVRLLFVQLTTFDIHRSLGIFCNRFGDGRIDHPKLAVNISRASIFNDGVLLLSRAGGSPLAFDVHFIDEPSVGVGPTHEFLTLLSEEFCRNVWGLWRSESTGEFAFHPLGLFPRPDGPLKQMAIVGTLCAKAFAMGTVLAFEFNPAFFSVARDQPIKLEDVDSELGHSLADPSMLVGMPFIYRGISALEMRPGGVTSETADEFVRLVSLFTVGPTVHVAAMAFREGFERVLPWSAMDIFSCEELSQLARGSNCSFTREELRKNMNPCHGYQEGTPQVEMLIDTLLEFEEDERAMFVRFVTGARALPIGGLAALRRKLSVALRISESGTNPDSTFPSVMTCANYLKLPDYSCKEVLKERLKCAITEFQNTFGLT